MIITESRLTTFDNPYDPFDQFTQWLLFDNEMGYNCCGKVDRVSNVTNDMTEQEKHAEIERAIDTIILYDFLNIFKKKTREITID